jgi:hypothetical protein
MHTQKKNDSFRRPDGAFGHANRDIWREWKSVVVIAHLRDVLV